MKTWGYNSSLDILLINSPLSDYEKRHPKYTVFQPPIGLATLLLHIGDALMNVNSAFLLDWQGKIEW